MELNEFISGFAEQFDETDASEIKADTVYMNLEEWSSLIGMSVIAFVKISFGKTISGIDLRTCKTVEELYNFIQSK